MFNGDFLARPVRRFGNTGWGSRTVAVLPADVRRSIESTGRVGAQPIEYAPHARDDSGRVGSYEHRSPNRSQARPLTALQLKRIARGLSRYGQTRGRSRFSAALYCIESDV